MQKIFTQKMIIVPIKQKEANRFVVMNHRHHTRVVGSIFQVGCEVDNKLVGVAICGRPVARNIDHKEVIEVNRLCVLEGYKNVCSKLYGACSRIAKEMGYKQIITYTLVVEPGLSLKASGWNNEGIAGGKKWSTRGRTNEIITLFGKSKKYPELPKNRWVKILNR